MRHNPDRGIMGQFMQQRAVITFGIAEALETRHLHVIVGDGIESPITSMPYRCAGTCRKILRIRDPRQSRKRLRRPRAELLRQSVDLLAIENGVTFEKGDFAVEHLALLILFGTLHAIGIDDKRTGFAFANLPAQFLGLAIGHPGWTAIAL
jgi:hypothetical protein